MLKTSLLKHLKISMDLAVASSLHGIKRAAGKRLRKKPKSLEIATSRSLICMLVLVTTLIKKIQGKHLGIDGMTQFKTHVDLMPI